MSPDCVWQFLFVSALKAETNLIIAEAQPFFRGACLTPVPRPALWDCSSLGRGLIQEFRAVQLESIILDQLETFFSVQPISSESQLLPLILANATLSLSKIFGHCMHVCVNTL